jgi:hypothetical protein
MRGEAAAAPIDRIRSHLVGLRMPRALETLDHVMQQLERGQVGAIEAVEMLLAEEITVRESRRVKAALQMSRRSTVTGSLRSPSSRLRLRHRARHRCRVALARCSGCC